MKIVDCRYERYGKAILDIFNRQIATSTALDDYEPRTLATIQKWLEYKQEHNYPILRASAIF